MKNWGLKHHSLIMSLSMIHNKFILYLSQYSLCAESWPKTPYISFHPNHWLVILTVLLCDNKMQAVYMSNMSRSMRRSLWAINTGGLWDYRTRQPVYGLSSAIGQKLFPVHVSVARLPVSPRSRHSNDGPTEGERDGGWGQELWSAAFDIVHMSWVQNGIVEYSEEL